MNAPEVEAGQLARWAEAVDAAAARLSGSLQPTPLRDGLGLGRLAGGSAPSLKLENHQPTGSFKVRGAFSKLLSLGSEERERGVVAASTGNHGAATAFAGRSLGIEVEVVVPETTPTDRAAAIERFGARVTRHGAECGESEARARELAASTGAVFVSPYNDPVVMAGQGTIGLELLEAAPDLDAVYVSAGGGGLLGGIAAAIASRRPEVEIVGVSPIASCALHRAVEAGRVIDVPHEPTLSLATAGAMEADSVTLLPCLQLVDRWLLVEEERIAEGMRSLFECERMVVEGAAGLAAAGWLADVREGRARERAAIVVCGGNVDQVDLVGVLGGGR